MIDAIADGSFAPDSQRSKFFVNAPEDAEKGPSKAGEADAGSCNAAKNPAEVESAVSELLEFSGGGIANVELDSGVASPSTPVAGDHDVATDDNGKAAAEEVLSSSSESSGDLSSAESIEPEPAARVKRFRARIPEGQCWFVHSKSHLVHRHDGDEVNGIKFTVCGKRLTKNYAPCTEATAWNVLCKSCNRK